MSTGKRPLDCRKILFTRQSPYVGLERHQCWSPLSAVSDRVDAANHACAITADGALQSCRNRTWKPSLPEDAGAITREEASMNCETAKDSPHAVDARARLCGVFVSADVAFFQSEFQRSCQAVSMRQGHQCQGLRSTFERRPEEVAGVVPNAGEKFYDGAKTAIVLYRSEGKRRSCAPSPLPRERANRHIKFSAIWRAD